MSKKLTDPNKRKKALFVEKLAEYVSVVKTSKAVRISRPTLYKWRDDDPDFKLAWDEAAKVGIEKLQDEAIRRAMEGVDKPVYQGGFKVGQIREYSDTLLIFLLKGMKPKMYRDKLQVDATVTGGVLLVNTPAPNIEAWAQRYAPKQLPSQEVEE